LITQLAVHSVPPVDGTVKYMNRTLDYWYKDLEGLLAGQIAKEHINQPAFSYASVDFVIGADHWQGSFRAGVKIIFRNHNGSIKATAINGLGKSECQKNTAELLALAFTPRLNVALNRIVCYVRNDKGQLVSDCRLAVYKKENLGQGAERETEEPWKGTRKEQKANQLQHYTPSWTEQASQAMQTHWY
jgi:hypothetical protein